MPEEATLDAFAAEAGDDSAEDDGSAAGASEAATGSDESVDGDSDDVVALAPVTSSWAGDGLECASCGEAAGRLWEEAGERVCTACKPW
ncbi:MAG: hypothetical protein ABEH83_01075 [Halobacterium sp.]